MVTAEGLNLTSPKGHQKHKLKEEEVGAVNGTTEPTECIAIHFFKSCVVFTPCVWFHPSPFWT